MRSPQAFAYGWPLSPTSPDALIGQWGLAAMEYNGFVVKAAEREPGKWRASVRRVNGSAIRVMSHSRIKLDKFVTGIDAPSAEAAMRMAIAAIDAGAFSRNFAKRSRDAPGPS
jgi:hypothetical protein